MGKSDEEKSEKKEKSKKIPKMPLKHIQYEASVNGIFAKVKCIQEFENDAENPVESIYAFPMPDESTVIGCVMKIGNRKVEAELKEAEQARQEYDEAVAQGHHATLLEQERPNIFTMNVGGIEPGEKINVEIDYVQKVPWQASCGRFTIPLVVAPRFIPGNPTGKTGSGWSEDTDEVSDASKITPVVAKEGVTYDADITMKFSPGFSCKLNSPSHASIVSETNVDKLDSIEITTGNIKTDRDFIIAYEPTLKMPEVSVCGCEVGGEDFRLISIFPPVCESRESKDIVFVLDISGSMDGAKIEGLKKIVKKSLERLKEQDSSNHVGVIVYSTSPRILSPLGEITQKMMDEISSINSEGNTYTGIALTLAHHQFKKGSERPKFICLISDGQTEDRDYTGSGVPIISVGIDSAVNDTFLKDVAAKSKGTAIFFYPGEDFNRASNEIVGLLSTPLLRNVKIDDKKGEVYGVRDLYQEMPVTIAVRYANEAPKVIKLTGKAPDYAEENWKMNISHILKCDFAHQIWAREFIRENQDATKQTEASLKYGVLCKHTSFVAVSLKQVPGKKPERVEIPVNLPAGWNYDKIFGQGPAMASVQMVGHAFSSKSVRGLRTSSYAGNMDMLCASLGPDNDQIGALDTDAVELGALDLSLNAEDSGGLEAILDEISRPESPTRFTLDAKNVVDRTIGILIAIAEGRKDEAEKAFKQLKKELTIQKVKKLSEYEKARLYYFATRLALYGLKFDDNIMTILQNKPKSNDATPWYNLALKDLGERYNNKIAKSHKDYDYLAWKFDIAYKQPTSSEWSLVP